MSQHTIITTISKPISDVIIKEKGSKFIGFAYPVQSEKEIQLYLEKLWQDHPKATHHCYAYRLGLNGEKYRANDDGEPSGSAGLPIYNQLLAHELTNVLVVVVRYYGGTKLGISGLIKTYKESAKETLAVAEIISKEIQVELKLYFPFEIQNQIFKILNKYNASDINFSYEEQCSIRAFIPLSKKGELSTYLSEIHTLKFEFEP